MDVFLKHQGSTMHKDPAVTRRSAMAIPFGSQEMLLKPKLLGKSKLWGSQGSNNPVRLAPVWQEALVPNQCT